MDKTRFHPDHCKNGNTCAAEAACPFNIDLRNQPEEMPAACCVCLNCLEACSFKNVITIRRGDSKVKSK